MKQRLAGRSGLLFGLVLAGASVALATPAAAQDRLKSMPGYEQYTRMAPQLVGVVKTGTVLGNWVDAGKAYEYTFDGKRYRFDAATKKVAETTVAGTPVTTPGGGRGAGGRGGAAGLCEADFELPDQIVQLGIEPYRIVLITGISGVPFEEAWADRVEAMVDGLPVPVISLRAYRRNKAAAGRPKDLGDLDALPG